MAILDVAFSVNNVPIRMTDERWFHIVENHDYLAGYYDDILMTVERPDAVLRGYGSAIIATRSMGRNRYLNVIYKDISDNDGFIITAFITPKINRKAIIWRSSS
jgi:hypothetical protein